MGANVFSWPRLLRATCVPGRSAREFLLLSVPTPIDASSRNVNALFEKSAATTARLAKTSPHVLIPNAASTRSLTFPTPPTLRTGRGFTRRKIWSRSLARTICPSGLFISEHTFASRRLGATPALHVRPLVFARTFARKSAAAALASTPRVPRYSVTSRNASSSETASKSASNSRNTSRASSAYRRYFGKSGVTNVKCGHNFFAMKPGMALRTPNVRAT